MKIVVTKKVTPPKRTSFEKEAWAESDATYYGKPLDWTEQLIVLTAQENEKDIGCLRLEIVEGVGYIDDLIVAKNIVLMVLAANLCKKQRKFQKN